MSKRRQYWVDSSIQWPFTRSVLASSICAAIYASIISYVVGAIIGSKAAGVDDISLTMSWLLRFPAVTVLTVLVGVSLLIGVMSWWGVRSSHKIAGPLVPIQRALERAREGDFSEPIQIREGDWMHDFVEELNITFDAVGQLQDDLKQRIAQLEGGSGSDEENDSADESPQVDKAE